MQENAVTRLLHKIALPRVSALNAVWQGLLCSMFDPYRPELYYMRGPGPKWQARHPDQNF
jgi:hypothetical protein